jgi:hypothetical protein
VAPARRAGLCSPEGVIDLPGEVRGHGSEWMTSEDPEEKSEDESVSSG